MNQIPIKCFSVSCFILRKHKGTSEVLILRRSSGSALGGEWCQIAGNIEKGESALEAVCREIQEETSIVNMELFSTTECEQYYRADLDCISVLPIFVGFVKSDVKIALNAEHDKYEWVSFDEAANFLTLPVQRRSLKFIKKDFVDRKPSKWLLVKSNKSL